MERSWASAIFPKCTQLEIPSDKGRAVFCNTNKPEPRIEDCAVRCLVPTVNFNKPRYGGPLHVDVALRNTHWSNYDLLDPKFSMSSAETHDEFIHHIAIKLSRALNIVNPNDLLAQRVTDIAKTNTLPGFISGLFLFHVIELEVDSSTAAKSFGKFQDLFLTELHAEILSHGKQEAAGFAPHPLLGITVHDSDVLVPEPAHPGGLFQRSDSV